ncbi:MAG: response regulator [Proteobacteria bacterium]|nr:response regulator [Pseudomonadota bacterium]
MSELSHILLVEDNKDDYEATLRSLKKNHFINPVHWCKSGSDALDYLHGRGAYKGTTSRPDLILLDLNMPGIDGRQVLMEIKSHKELKSIPVVILTTSADAKDVEQCYAIGASTYIQKPVSFEGLTEAIHTMKDYWFNIAILPSSESRFA